MIDSSKNKRIFKNTLVLYVRMLFLMVITLYTSRVILDALGVEDYGIYNVVGGFVALFAIVSRSLSGAESRFLNYAMGTDDKERVKTTFSSIVTIQVFLAIVVAILAEAIGVWFLNNKMVIPHDRLVAANWCFQLSVLTFCYNLFAVPYNAAIIAHEKMKVFAYVSIVEGIAKLAISYLIFCSPIDKLVFYAILLCLLQIVVREMYRHYCLSHFEECKYKFIYDKSFLKELLSYAGWGYIGSTADVLRNQGINVLINLFFGPAINAARAIANQVLHAVDGFINNFMVAVRPQMVQSYAAGNIKYVNELIIMSSKFSYYLFLILSLPIIFNTDTLLHLWLKVVPDQCAIFVQLTLVFTMITILYRPIAIAQAATGKIRDYQLVVSGVQLLNLPISYCCLKYGCHVAVVLVVAIVLATIVLFLSMYMIRRIMPFDAMAFFRQVLLRVLFVTTTALIVPSLINFLLPHNMFWLIIGILVCLFTTVLSVFVVGCNEQERSYVIRTVINIYNSVLRKK